MSRLLTPIACGWFSRVTRDTFDARSVASGIQSGSGCLRHAALARGTSTPPTRAGIPPASSM